MRLVRQATVAVKHFAGASGSLDGCLYQGAGEAGRQGALGWGSYDLASPFTAPGTCFLLDAQATGLSGQSGWQCSSPTTVRCLQFGASYVALVCKVAPALLPACLPAVPFQEILAAEVLPPRQGMVWVRRPTKVRWDPLPPLHLGGPEQHWVGVGFDSAVLLWLDALPPVQPTNRAGQCGRPAVFARNLGYGLILRLRWLHRHLGLLLPGYQAHACLPVLLPTLPAWRATRVACVHVPTVPTVPTYTLLACRCTAWRCSRSAAPPTTPAPGTRGRSCLRRPLR